MNTNQDFPPYITKHELLKSLQAAADAQVDIVNIRVTTPDLKGCHFISAVETIDVTTRNTKTGKDELVKLFAKFVTPDKSREEKTKSVNPTRKEVFFFNKVLPTLRKFCKEEAAEGKALTLSHYPYCYYAADSKYGPVIMDNLIAQGYKLNTPARDQCDDHVKLVLKNMAKFHAVSAHYLRKTNNEIVNKNSFLNFNFYSPEMKIIFGNSITDVYKTGISVLMSSEHMDKFKLLDALSDSICEDFAPLTTPEEPFNVICMGDCWNNNMMFKYNYKGKPIDMKFVDFQVLRYDTMAYDICMFLLTSTDHTKWKEDMSSYLQLYYDSFNRTIRCFKDVESCWFSFENFKKHIYQRIPSALPFMFTICGIRFLPSEEFTNPGDENQDSDFIGEICNAVRKIIARNDLNIILTNRVLSAFDVVEEGIKEIIRLKDEIDIYHVLPPYITRDQLLKSLQTAADASVGIVAIKVTTPNLKGCHFLSAVDTIDVTTRNTKTGKEELVKLFVKFVTRDGSRKETMKAVNPTAREVFFFNEVLPTLKKFCKEEAADGKFLTLSHYPYCYYAAANNYDPVIMENLVAQGYKLNTPTIDQCDDHVNLVLKNMAKFHAVSAHYLRKTQNEFVKKHAFLEMNFYSPDMKVVFGDVFKDIYEAGISVLQTPEHTEKFELLNTFTNSLFEDFVHLTTPEDPFNVICMGDCWNNNMMFKYDAGNKPIDVKFLDFQIVRHDTMAYDLTYFMLTSTDHTKWKKDMSSYLQLYYDSFNRTIRCFKDVESCWFSFDDFKKHIYLRFPISVPIMFSVCAIRYLSSDEFTDPGEANEGSNFMEEVLRAVKKMATEDGLKKILKDRLLSAYEVTEGGFREIIHKRDRLFSNCVQLPYIMEDQLLKSLQAAAGAPVEIVDIKVTIPDIKGGHFISAVETIDVTARNIKTGKEELVKLFAKFVTPDESRQETMKAVNPTRKEVFFFNEVLPTLRNFCKEEVAHGKLLTLSHYPYCYYAAESKYDPVILENLVAQGYKLNTPTRDQCENHVSLVLKNMAKFHAVSAYYLRKNSSEFIKKHAFLDMNFFSMDMKAVFGDVFKDIYQAGISVLQTPEHMEKFQLLNTFTNSIFEDFQHLATPEDPFNVICMGDCWNNNMMFKYDTDDKPIDVKFLDFQVVRHDTMAYDLNYFLLTSTDHTKWKKDMSSYLKLYYHNFNRTIRCFKDVKSCWFTFNDFEKHIYQRIPTALPIMFTICAVRFLSGDEFTDPGEANEGTDFMQEIARGVKKMATGDDLKDVLRERLLSAYEITQCGFREIIRRKNRISNNYVLPPYITEDQLLISLQTAALAEVDIVDIKVTTPDLKGGHFVSAVETIDVTTRNTKTGKEELVKLFAKFVTRDESRQEAMESVNPTTKEVFFFKELLPTLRNFCKEEAIEGKLVTLSQYPYCYYAALSKYDPVILENLVAQGYKINTPTIDQSEDHVFLVLKNMAKFHAVSAHYLRKTNNEIVKQHSFLEFSLYSPDMKAIFGDIFKEIFKIGISILKTSDHMEKFELLDKLTDSLYEDFRPLTTPEEPFNVICMGDCWNNNMMFKYSKDGEPIDMKFLDFQIVRYDTMAYDLIYYLLTSTDYTKWQTNLILYLQHYYDCFNQTIGCFKDIESCWFTFEDFKKLVLLRMPNALPIMCSICAVRFLESDGFTDPGNASDGSNFMDEFPKAVQKMIIRDDLKDTFKDRLISAYNISETGIKEIFLKKVKK